MKLGQRIPTELKEKLYRIGKVEWRSLPAWVRVRQLNRRLEEKDFTGRLVSWIAKYRDAGRLLDGDKLTSPENLVANAIRRAKNSVAAGRGIEEAISYWVADGLYGYKPYTNFNKIRFDIRQVIDGKEVEIRPVRRPVAREIVGCRQGRRRVG